MLLVKLATSDLDITHGSFIRMALPKLRTLPTSQDRSLSELVTSVLLYTAILLGARRWFWMS